MKTIKLFLEMIGSLLKQITRRWLVFAVVTFLIFCFVYYRLFSIYLPEHRSWYAIGILSLSMLLPASAFYFLPHFFRERKLLRSANDPRLVDGKRTAVHGKLESSEQPVLTPFTKKPCLYYQYTIYRYAVYQVLTGDGNKLRSKTINDFAGFGGIPYFLQTSMGNFKLQGIYPTESISGKVKNSIEADNIDRYIKETVFEERNDSMIFLPAAKRSDYRRPGMKLDRDIHEFSEGYIPPHAEVCIIGQWSDAFGGLVASGISLKAYSVLKGGPEGAVRSLSSRIAANILLALFLTAFIHFFAFVMLTSK